uniref:CCHC-type domain-containing protein n=1 Tax=Triticum urartu TaxID=4572 RepID=A0A8R7TRJ0_TRIUA
MAEISDAPAVTSGELAAVLRAMDEKYRALFDAISKQASSSKSEAEIKEEIHPLQMPHVKLEGPENYVSWAEHAETILVSRKLEGYIIGTVEKPEEEGSKEGQKWRATNALVRAWLLSSMSSQIAKQVERIKDASEIWRLLKGTYSGVGNEMLACKIQNELQELSQGERTVVEYVSELKRLWSDLDYYDPVEMECGKCIEKHSKWTERRRVRDFLNGLHPRFENRRAALYGSGKLPSLEQAISAIASEETRLRLEAAGSASQGVTQRRSAFSAAGGGRYQRTGAGNGERKCFECGSPEHLGAGCPKLMGGGRGRGQDWRGRARGRLFDACGGRGRGMLFPGRANTSTAEEVSQKLSIEITPDELEKWRQFKNLNLGVEQPQESHASSSSSANFSGTWNWKRDWDREHA